MGFSTDVWSLNEIDSEIWVLVEFADGTGVCKTVGSSESWASFDEPSPIFNPSDNETV